MFKCKYCDKLYDQAFNCSNHQGKCPKNPNRRLPKNFRNRNDIEAALDNNGKLYGKWLNKRNNAKLENIEFNLSYYEFCLLVKEAGLVSSDLGFSGKNYVLARFNDSGPYAYGNCRFILQSENAKEKRISDKAREASRKSMQYFNSHRSEYYTDEEVSAYIKAGKKRNISDNVPKIPRSVDTKNSQYGTYWITNGIDNKKWKDSKGPIPTDYYKGRVMNR